MRGATFTWRGSTIYPADSESEQIIRQALEDLAEWLHIDSATYLAADISARRYMIAAADA